jgi:hypothetical protein
MSFFDRLFGGNPQSTTGAVNVPAPVVEVPFHEKAVADLNGLAVWEKKISGLVSTEVFSLIRSIDDVLRPLVKFLESHLTAIEFQIFLTKMITEYIPDPLNIFFRLPAADQVPGGEADLLLIEQYVTILKNAQELSDNIHDQVMNELKTQAIFIDNRFREGV